MHLNYALKDTLSLHRHPLSCEAVQELNQHHRLLHPLQCSTDSFDSTSDVNVCVSHNAALRYLLMQIPMQDHEKVCSGRCFHHGRSDLSHAPTPPQETDHCLWE